MTSVKDVRVSEPPTRDALGVGSFHFTDDYSVFDWGQMPDEIPQKGASLCAMGACNFELLEEADVPTHYRGVVSPGGGARGGSIGGDAATAGDRDPVPFSDVDSPPREMAIDLAQVPELPHEGTEYDYEAYHDAAGECYVVPLEIVFRNGVPVGSSLRRRTDPVDHGLEYEEWPEEPVSLEEPVVEFSTKYEESDRYLDRAEADAIAGAADVDDLEVLARTVDRVVTERADERGFRHEDGKIEVAYHDGDLLVADVVGTFDENRFAYDGQQLSKEVIRQYYRREQPGWVAAVEEAKVEATERGLADWKSICEVEPEPLPDFVLGAVRDMYASGANAYLARELFDAPPIDDAVAVIANL